MDKSEKSGYLLATSAYLIWGVLTAYWKQLSYLSALEILAVRVVFSFVTLVIVVHIQKNPLYLEYIKDKEIRRKLFVTGILIALNWIIFVYAVNSDNVVQASFGYYINPLISIALGVVVLREHLKKIQYVAIAFAFICILYMTIQLGSLPWISLSVAFSFGFYGLFKKKYGLDSLNSLIIETLLMLPFILMITIWMTRESGTNIMSSTPVQWLFIVFAGVITIVPLILFAEGTYRIPLSSVGFLQFITPTMLLIIGVFAYSEPFTKTHGISLAFIWLGVILNLYISLSSAKKQVTLANKDK